MADFKCMSDNELSRLSDEQLVEYIADAADAGRLDCAKNATAILAFGYWDKVRFQVWRKIPRQDVDDVTAIVIEGAAHSTFSGKTVGEFRAWLNTITRRRIADYHRSREGNPIEGPLPEENPGDEGIWGDGAISDDDAVIAEYREAAGRLLEKRSPIHQLVIRLNGPEELNYLNLPADEVVAQIEAAHPGETVSVANVYQIWKRFKTDLEGALEMGGS